MGWFIIVIAGMFEVVGAVGLNYAKGFTRLTPSIVTLAGFAASFALLTLSLRTLPLGTAYAVWTGIGTVGTAIAGILLFNEPATLARVLCIGLIIAGIVGLKLVTAR